MSRKPIDAEDIAVLLRLQAALPDVGLNGWFEGVRVLARVIEHLTAAQQQGQAPPPSAPVVDEAMTRRIMADFHANDPGDVWPPDEQGRLRRQALQDAINKHISAAPALAQQPAAAPIVGGTKDTSTFSDVEDALDRIEAPARADDGRWLTLPERIAALQQPAAVDGARFRKAPCYLCGYNGAGYFQPETHPCAALYHAAQPGGSDNDR